MWDGMEIASHHAEGRQFRIRTRFKKRETNPKPFSTDTQYIKSNYGTEVMAWPGDATRAREGDFSEGGIWADMRRLR